MHKTDLSDSKCKYLLESDDLSYLQGDTKRLLPGFVNAEGKL